MKPAKLLWAAIPAALLLTFRLVRSNTEAVTFFVRRVTSPLKYSLSLLWGLLPLGMAEVIWAAAILFLVCFIVGSAVQVFRSAQPLALAGRRLFALCCMGLWVYTGYTLLWGANYYAYTFTDLSGLRPRSTTAQELYALTVAFADEASRLAEEMPRDEEGLYARPVSEILTAAPEVYRPVCGKYPFLAGPERRPKPMVFSKLMSYLGFTGFYFPFTGESLLNVDQPRYLIPVTALHELCHQRNIAPEDECNFLAILAGMESGDPEFRYSAAMFAYIHLSNALYRADRNLLAEAAAHLNEAAQADNRANNAYWARYETPVETVGTTVYEGFLQSFEQTDGMESYGKCVDLLAAYYLAD